MRKITLTAIALTILAVFASCGQERPETVSYEGMRWVLVQASATPVPGWVNASAWEAGNNNGDEVYYILVEGEAKTKEKAKIAAELARVSALAAAVKEISTTMLASACSGMLNGDSAVETYFERTTAAVSRNADTSGAFPVATYWEYGQYIDDEAGTKLDSYRYVIRYSISQRKLEEAMARAWEQTGGNYPDDIIAQVQANVPGLAGVTPQDTAQQTTQSGTQQTAQNDTQQTQQTTGTTAQADSGSAENITTGGRVRGQNTSGNVSSSVTSSSAGGRIRGQGSAGSSMSSSRRDNNDSLTNPRRRPATSSRIR